MYQFSSSSSHHTIIYQCTISVQKFQTTTHVNLKNIQNELKANRNGMIKDKEGEETEMGIDII